MLISSLPLIFWREERPTGICRITQNRIYTLLSTLGAFWLPLLLIIIVYAKIYRVAHRRVRARSRASCASFDVTSMAGGTDNPSLAQRRRSSSRRLRSSARTLGLIIGAFTICWLPFFTLTTIQPFIPHVTPPGPLVSIALWLGYINSLVNPAIYVIWDKHFRQSFRRFLTCKAKP